MRSPNPAPKGLPSPLRALLDAAAPLAAALVLAGAPLLPSGARAEVFHSRESALAAAFPDADRVDATPRALGTEQRTRVEALAGVELDSGLVSAWTARRDGRVVGTAYLDTRTVRTLPATLLVVVSPEGTVAGIHLVAFHEPPQYRPPARWMDGLRGRPLDDRLWPGREVDGLSGATMSARAFTAAVRRVLAIHAVCAGEGDGPDLAIARPARP